MGKYILGRGNSMPGSPEEGGLGHSGNMVHGGHFVHMEVLGRKAKNVHRLFQAL